MPLIPAWLFAVVCAWDGQTVTGYAPVVGSSSICRDCLAAHFPEEDSTDA